MNDDFLRPTARTPEQLAEEHRAEVERTERSIRHMNSRNTLTLGHVMDLLESFAKNPDPAAIARDLRERWRV